MLSILNKVINADVPILFWGAPGVGKTAAIGAFAEKQKVHIEVVIGSTMDPTDMGRPVVTADGSVTLAPPPWAQRLKSAVDAGQEAWLFLDELNTAPPGVQAALLRLINERHLADLDLSGVKIIAAANPVSQAVDAVDLSAASANRFCHVDWAVDLDEWCAGELSGWGETDKSLAGIRAAIVAFIRKTGTLLDPPDDSAEDIRGWPSPRSWSLLAKSVGDLAFLQTKAGQQIAEGLVGPAALEMVSWVREQDLPNPEDILSGKASIPERGDRAYAAVTGVIAYAVAHDKQTEAWGVLTQLREDLSLTSASEFRAAIEASGEEVQVDDNVSEILDRLRSNA